MNILKKTPSLLLLISAPFMLFAFAAQWVEFISYDGKFTVMSPQTMIEKTTSAETAIGKLEYHSFICQMPDGEASENLLYMVSYCDYPLGSMHADSTALMEDFFQSTIEESTRSIKGELMYSADYQYDGYPGKTWRVDYNNHSATIRTKSFIFKNRLYTLQTVCRQKQNMNNSSDRFFDSFRLLK